MIQTLDMTVVLLRAEQDLFHEKTQKLRNEYVKYAPYILSLNNVCNSALFKAKYFKDVLFLTL